MRRTALTLGCILFISGCGFSSRWASEPDPSDDRSSGGEQTAALERRRIQPCPSFLDINPVQSTVRGVWLANRRIPFKMRIAGKLQINPGLRDVSEILLVLDDWRTDACKSRRTAKGAERAKIDRKIVKVDNYLRAFTLVLTIPYTTRGEAEEELRKWVREVRDRLLRELMRGTG